MFGNFPILLHAQGSNLIRLTTCINIGANLKMAKAQTNLNKDDMFYTNNNSFDPTRLLGSNVNQKNIYLD